MDAVYKIVAAIVWVVTFIGIWGYAFAEWGFLMGLTFGWFPAFIGATIIAFAWPFLAIIALGFGLWIYGQS